jgi:alpha-beta hydrolase superfamily lysophospholipase
MINFEMFCYKQMMNIEIEVYNIIKLVKFAIKITLVGIEMFHIEGILRSVDGLDLYYQTWYPAEVPKAVIGILHGLGSHSGWFSGIAEALVAQGYVVYGMDLRGHGRSPGQRAYINHWSEFRADFAALHQLMIRQYPHLPCFALGHSLGAVILLDAVLHGQPLSGFILMAPSLNPTGVPAWRLALARLLSWVYPRFSLNTGILEGAGSRDPAIIAAYRQDALRHHKGTARLATEFLRTIQWIKTNLQHLQTPVLILHGTLDVVTSPTKSRILFEQLPLRNKQYCEYTAAYHDLHTDLDMPQVISDVADWLDVQCQLDLKACTATVRH